MSEQIATLGSLAASQRPIGSPLCERAMLLLAAAVAFVVAAHMGDAAATARSAAADPALSRLLRAMAALKAIVAIAAIGTITWRLGSPVGPLRLALYALATSAMTAGPVLIWTLAHVGPGAALLHCGLALALVLLCRDPAGNARLQAAITARRTRA